jgi:hypothetical protein
MRDRHAADVTTPLPDMFESERPVAMQARSNGSPTEHRATD